jgi:hypothetical protein
MIHSLEVPGPVRELAARLAEPQPMRRVSLSERYVKCSKPGCGCAANPRARPGPYYSFPEGREWLRELAGVEVEAQPVERRAEQRGAEVAKEERQQAEAGREGPLPPTLDLGLEGTGIPLRRA